MGPGCTRMTTTPCLFWRYTAHVLQRHIARKLLSCSSSRVCDHTRLLLVSARGFVTTRKGNVLQAGATLFPSDLERNGVNDAATIYNLIYSGKNKMPGYGSKCEPRGQCTFGARLSDDEIRGVVDYVLEQSAQGWK